MFYLNFGLFLLLYTLLGVMVLAPLWFIAVYLFLVLWTRYFINNLFYIKKFNPYTWLDLAWFRLRLLQFMLLHGKVFIYG